MRTALVEQAAKIEQLERVVEEGRSRSPRCPSLKRVAAKAEEARSQAAQDLKGSASGCPARCSVTCCSTSDEEAKDDLGGTTTGE